MVIDPIADLLTRIKNAIRAGHPSVILPFSKIKIEIARALVRAGYLKSVETIEKSFGKNTPRKYLDVTLSDKKITNTRRVSRVSRRVYSGIKDLKLVKQGFGVSILSTTKGILTDREAKKEKLGGEVLLTVY